uniref:Uncharacterized protein n=1 Tax=Triticum urartu TaxID=4572 RepID=A0A8R7VEU5_TRIUA
MIEVHDTTSRKLMASNTSLASFKHPQLAYMSIRAFSSNILGHILFLLIISWIRFPSENAETCPQQGRTVDNVILSGSTPSFSILMNSSTALICSPLIAYIDSIAFQEISPLNCIFSNTSLTNVMSSALALPMAGRMLAMVPASGCGHCSPTNSLKITTAL